MHSAPQFLHISGELVLFLAPLVAFVISFFTSMAGVSGAFLLLPFQVSLLGFTSPSVNATNFLFNVIGCPGGVFRFVREKRMIWPLALWITAGTLPGIFLGYYVRVRYLPDPRLFKFFVGFVLLYIGLLLFRNSLRQVAGKPGAAGKDFTIGSVKTSWSSIDYSFRGEQVHVKTPTLSAFSFFVGIIGGIYGVGGGALMVPFCVTFLRIPVHTVAGSTLFATFAASISGVFFYSFVPVNGETAPPDWILGILLGIGGLAGMYCGAKFQKKVPEKWIKIMLSVIIILIAAKYLSPLFSK
ncbi:MAG: sulfite exporter TauE/SafE family protein [Pseudomonadota bacterium]